MRSIFESETDTYMQPFLKNQFPHFFWTSLEKSKNQAVKFNKEAMSISLTEGALISFLVERFQCRKFLEIGSFTGASAHWISWALGEAGSLTTLEKDERHYHSSELILSEFAKEAKRSIQCICTDAEAYLATSRERWDGVFLDANKSAYPKYLELIENQLRIGGLLIADNCLHQGLVFKENADKKYIRGIQEFNRKLFESNIFKPAMVPSLEGLAIAIKIR